MRRALAGRSALFGYRPPESAPAPPEYDPHQAAFRIT